MQILKKVNQTGDSSENNKGEKDELALSPEVCSVWLGRRDSNPRMLVPKTSALPLGDAPLNRLILAVLCRYVHCLASTKRRYSAMITLNIR